MEHTKGVAELPSSDYRRACIGMRFTGSNPENVVAIYFEYTKIFSYKTSSNNLFGFQQQTV